MNGLRRNPAARLAPAVLLVALMWVVRFWHSSQFGLYEDDLTHWPKVAAMSLDQVVSYSLDVARIARLEGQGHPLHFSFIYLLSHLGNAIGSLRATYWIGFAVEAFNLLLFYGLLSRVHSWRLGLLGGLAYALYSADTTQAFLTHALGLQPSLTILLLASLAYVSGRKWLAYLLAPLTLLTYETVYPVFLGIPLLLARPRRERIRELLVHAAIVGSVFVLVLVWRLQSGDDRLGGLGIADALAIPVVHMIQGPVVSLGTYVYRAWQTVVGADPEVVIAGLLGCVTFAVIVSRIDLGLPEGLRRTLGSAAATIRRGRWSRAAIGEAYRSLPTQFTDLLRLIGAGMVMLVLAYPLTFTVRAYAVSGRETRVHAAGVVGAALLVGSLILVVLWAAEAYGRRRWVAVAIGGWLGLLLGYGFVLQRDYREAWRLQQEFWRAALPQIIDGTEGTVIVVDPGGLVDTLQIGANTWNLPRVLEQLYQLPESWETPPRVFRGVEEWREYLILPDGSLRINGDTTMAPEGTHTTTTWDHLIVIETDGEVQRRLRPLVIDAVPYPLTQPGRAVLSAYPTTTLYDLLIGARD